MGKSLKALIMCFMVAIAFVLLAFYLAGPLKPYQAVTADQMYQSLADFYSVALDRSDLKSGEFKQWPARGEKVSFRETLEFFSVSPPYTFIGKEFDPRKNKITIKSEEKPGGLNVLLGLRQYPVRVGVNIPDSKPNFSFLRREEREALVWFVVEGHIKVSTSEQCQALERALEGKTGKKVQVKGIVDAINNNFLAEASLRYSYYGSVYYGSAISYSLFTQLSNPNSPIRIRITIDEIEGIKF